MTIYEKITIQTQICCPNSINKIINILFYIFLKLCLAILFQ